MVDWSSVISRRAFLAGSAVTFSGLAGCSTTSPSDESTSPEAVESPIEQILVRSDTGEKERVRLTLVYGPPEGHTERPIWSTFEAPADGKPITVGQSLETGAGIYSLTAASKQHANHEVVSFNSLTSQDETKSQFEVVVKHTGDIWVNLNDAGEPINIP
ncbi:hypothetical protein [Halobacterium wangiae]|uniref:hypothetical protein n=1 Tax=Halobacterium wangiae TaxID=2902623 RepID=UPI001E426C6D|nr:hypothetical protein [Halobacterium wangiae]